jgi:acyl carrier protein
MAETRERLRRCFSAVFPVLSGDQLDSTSPSNLAAWDSVASVTLFAVVEEEFAIEIDVQEMPDLLSFANLLKYLEKLPRQSGA